MVVLLTALSGCTTEPEPTQDVQEHGIITDPTDYSYLENQTDGSGWHVHDYWRGQDRLVLAEVEQPIDFRCAGGCSFASYGRGVGRLPAGTVVPQGASHVEITVSYEFDADHPTPVLAVKTAADKEAREIGPVASGALVVFNSTNEMNDPPHRSLSGWSFPLTLSGTGQDGYDFSGTIRMTIEAVRGLEIPAYPPHPDFWQGRDRIPLFENEGGQALYMEQDGGTWTCYIICEWSTHSPGDGIVVPFDASHVEVQLTYGTGMPTGLVLAYHGADQWDMTSVDGEGMIGETTTFTIPMDQPMGDSPYASQSLWQFRLRADDQPTGPPSRWTGEYTVSAWAVKTA